MRCERRLVQSDRALAVGKTRVAGQPRIGLLGP
jgi:hypothetical protein